MTISTTPSEVSYATDGVTTSFPIPFVFGTVDDLKVVLTDDDGNVTEVTTGFTTTGGNGSTGTLVFASAPEDEQTLTIIDDPALEQSTDYVSNDAFPAESHEEALDYLTRLVKRLSQQNLRALRTRDGDPLSGDDLILPSVQNRASRLMAFDADGKPEPAAAVDVPIEALTRSLIGALLHPQTPAESAAGVTPTNHAYPPGHVFRYLSDAQVNDVTTETASLDLTSALDNWINCGHSELYAPNGKYRVAGTVIAKNTGITICGESDYNTVFVADGSGPWLQIGDSDYTLIEHATVKNITHIAGANFTGDCLIKTKLAFQTYFERVRYKRTLNHPEDAIYILDNNSGEAELPVRVTFRDCYIDGANYAEGAPAVPCPCAIWNPSGIQVVIDNTHIQDTEIGIKCGVDPDNDDAYVGSNDDFADVYFLNNSRYQVGDRGSETTGARAFDLWKGGNVVVANSQIYLNNNGPDPALPGQRVARFNDEFANFSMTNCVVNFNSRADHAFTVKDGASVGMIQLNGNAFIANVASKELVEVESGGSVDATVIDETNYFQNPNTRGTYRYLLDTDVSTVDLGTASGIIIECTDGTSRTIGDFTNGAIGKEYRVEVYLSGGASLSITGNVSAGTTSGIDVDGTSGTISLQNGDVLLVYRSHFGQFEKYYAKILRIS